LDTKEHRAEDLGPLTAGAWAIPCEWVQKKIPTSVHVFGAHTDIDEDVDGRIVSAAGMKERMEAASVRSSIVFPLNDPHARDDYSRPNDGVWAAYDGICAQDIVAFRAVYLAGK
jgi:hypothetical protein